MRILFFGDVVGMDATRLLGREMPKWRAATKADVIVVNVENALVSQWDDPRTAYGTDAEIADILTGAGVDVLTGGNHSWDVPDNEAVFERPNILRPHNMIAPTQGRGILEMSVASETLVVVNLIGDTAIYPPLRSHKPLAVFEELTFPPNAVVLVDYHSERILEKRTFGHAIDGRATLVVGTHTHEPTLRLERFPRGTFFVGDAGMCGPSGGVVGMAPDWYVRRLRGKPEPGFRLADGPIQIGAIVLDTAAERIERFLPD